MTPHWPDRAPDLSLIYQQLSTT
jgi:hypothetical protein